MSKAPPAPPPATTSTSRSASTGTPVDPLPFMAAPRRTAGRQGRTAPQHPRDPTPAAAPRRMEFDLPPAGTPRRNSLTTEPPPIPAPVKALYVAAATQVPPALDPARRDRDGGDRPRRHPRNLTRRRPRPDAVHARHLRDLRGRRRPRRAGEHHQRRRQHLLRRELPHQVRRHHRSGRGASCPVRVQPRRLVRQRRPALRPRLRRQTPPTPRPAPTEVAERGRQAHPNRHQGTATPTREEHHAAGPTHHPLPAHLGDPADRGHGHRARPGPRRAPGPRHRQCPYRHRLGAAAASGAVHQPARPARRGLPRRAHPRTGRPTRAAVHVPGRRPRSSPSSCSPGRPGWRGGRGVPAGFAGWPPAPRPQALLGPSRLRRVAPVVRPDRYGNRRHR